MFHVLLRLSVWLLVFGIGYLLFGPDLFDSSRSADPFATDRTVFLPPAKTQRELEYETVMQQRDLDPEEQAAYEMLVQQRQAGFWRGDGVSVEEALAGVPKQRKQYLSDLLIARGLSGTQLAIFLAVVERDHAALLADRQ